jgi:transposase
MFCPTQRAADKWDSPPFTGFIHALSESCSQAESRLAHLRPTHTVRYYVLKKWVIFGKLLRKGKTRKELTMSGKKRNSKATNTRVQLRLSFELGEQDWTLGFTVGLGQEPRKRKIAARDLKALEQEIARAKQRFGLPDTAPVQSCYEAGRDGFWLHRYLTAHHIENLVVDSSSIEVNRRAKRPKTDRIDAGKLVKMLVRYDLGERKLWSVVHVPSVEAEDARHLHRELLALKRDQTRHINRLKGLLAGQGVSLPVGAHFLEQLDTVRLWDGAMLPPGVRARLEREYTCYQSIHQHILEVEGQRAELLRTAEGARVDQVRRLLRLCGIGENSAWLYVMEFFGWREFHNRRDAKRADWRAWPPRPLTAASNRATRASAKPATARSAPWRLKSPGRRWLRYQPDSELSRWYNERFGKGGKRLRKISIVALARKLLIALWRSLEDGVIPAGAQLKPASAS